MFLGIVAKFFFDDFITEFDTLVANVDSRSCDELAHLALAFLAEGTLEGVCRVGRACHGKSPFVASFVQLLFHTIFGAVGSVWVLGVYWTTTTGPNVTSSPVTLGLCMLFCANHCAICGFTALREVST